MNGILPESTREDVLPGLRGRTAMLVGATGVGKTTLARSLASALSASAGPVALVSADMGQQSVGVPTCIGLSLGEPWDRATAMWFVGDITPRGNLLPTVVGTAMLAQRARAEGARTMIIDTTGMVGDPLGPLLKYH